MGTKEYRDLAQFRKTLESLYKSEFSLATVDKESLLKNFSTKKGKEIVNKWLKGEKSALSSSLRSRKNAFRSFYKEGRHYVIDMRDTSLDRVADNEARASLSGVFYPELQKYSDLEMKHEKMVGAFKQVTTRYENLTGNLIHKERFSQKKINEYSNTIPPIAKVQQRENGKDQQISR